MSENDTIPKQSKSQINKAVFFTSALLIFLLVAFAAVFPDVADKNFDLDPPFPDSFCILS